MPTDPAPLSSRLLWLMAVTCGITVANIYYNQPLLGDFAAYFKVDAWKAGLVATAAQVGYGAGLLFFVPLGDLLERLRLILVLIGSCAVSLVGVACAPALPFLIFAQLLVGMSAVSAQVLIPLATDLVAPDQRGKLIGALMSGLLCGILLGRVFAGFVSDWFGWRAVYGAAAIAMALLGLILRSRLPHRPPSIRMSYPQLMFSMLALLRTQPTLLTASVISALSFASFSAFWTTLSFLMAERFHLGASESGLFGIIGLVGAAGAPWAGKLSDRKGSGFTIALALLISAVSYILMGLWVTLGGLIVGVFLMDLGVQSIQVAAQSQVIALLPEARSRLNTLYMVGRFGGGALGSAFGALAWSVGKWPGVSWFCLITTVLALVVQLLARLRVGSTDLHVTRDSV
jgi:predicted MFS family arabinose efflux permease